MAAAKTAKGKTLLLPIPSSLAAAIARRRRELGVSLKNLGYAAGVSRQSVLFVEHDAGNTSFNVAARLAYALGMPFEVIADGLREALEIATRDMNGYRGHNNRAA